MSIKRSFFSLRFLHKSDLLFLSFSKVIRRFINLKNNIQKPKINFYDAIILAVGHHQFIHKGAKSIRTYGKKNHVFFDLKYAFDASETDERL